MTTLAVADAINTSAIFYREELADGSMVWVAEDPNLDGCMAQAATREEAAAALEENRRNYLALTAALRSSPAPRPAPAGQVVFVVAYDATDTSSGVPGQAVTMVNG